jgi:hypothetical protein
MKITSTNWKYISEVIIEVGSKVFWNDPTCKDKWGAIYGNLKKIHDYMGGVIHNEKYWNINPKDKFDL